MKSSWRLFNVLQYTSWVWPERRLCKWNVPFFSYWLFQLDGQDCCTEFQSWHGHGPYVGQRRSSDKKCAMHSVIYVHQPKVTHSPIGHLWCICEAVELNKLQFSKANQPKTSVDCNFGQFSELVNESMPLRVFGFSLRFTLKVNMSVSIFQWRPNTRWMGGLALSRSRSNNNGALSSCGMKFSTFELLLSHFVSRNPPLERRLRSCTTIWMAQSTDFTDLRQSFT